MIAAPRAGNQRSPPQRSLDLRGLDALGRRIGGGRLRAGSVPGHGASQPSGSPACSAIWGLVACPASKDRLNFAVGDEFCQPSASQRRAPTPALLMGWRKTCEPLEPCCFRFSRLWSRRQSTAVEIVDLRCCQENLSSFVVPRRRREQRSISWRSCGRARQLPLASVREGPQDSVTSRAPPGSNMEYTTSATRAWASPKAKRSQ